MQKIRSLLLAAGVFASVVTGTVVVPLIQPAPALAAVHPHVQDARPLSAPTLDGAIIKNGRALSDGPLATAYISIRTDTE
jgi:hypothetical protein